MHAAAFCLLCWVLGILAHVSLASSSSSTAACGQYNTTARRDPTRLNVHLVPHTHDDAGWLKTFDQYFWGTRQDIQVSARNAGVCTHNAATAVQHPAAVRRVALVVCALQAAAVQHVLSTVVQCLQDNPDRRFSYAEMVSMGQLVTLTPAVVSRVQSPRLPQPHPCSAPSQLLQSFFSAWWRRQSPAVQASVRDLVAAGRLAFINGGWVQHDEAAAHYAAMIDQTTRGHRSV